MRLLITILFIVQQFVCEAQFFAEEKTLSTNSGDLKGTLIIPSKTKKFKLVIIQAGSGPTDRNGNSGSALKTNSYKLMAEEFAKNNIATLLIDKRGVGGSKASAISMASFKFENYADDLADWIRFAKKDKRIAKIFIAGHSEGSLVGMLAAQKEKVNGYISLAGAGESIDKIIVWQYAQQLPQATSVVDSFFTRLKNKEKIDSVPPYLMPIFSPYLQNYLASWIKYDPCTEIEKLKIPVLIIQGTTDIQVQVKQAEMLKRCKPNATYKLIDGMNHILKEAPIDRTKNIATYSNETLPIMPGLVDLIAAFVNKK